MFKTVSGTVNNANDSRRLWIDSNTLAELRNVLVERLAVGEVVFALRVIENRISIQNLTGRISMGR